MIKKRSIISVLVIIAMICSAGLFTACNDEEKVETIKYNMKITSWDNSIEDSFDGIVLEGTADELTVLAATRKMVRDVLDIEFDYDASIGTVKRIGPNISELFRHEFPADPCDKCDELEDGELCEECAAEAEEDVVRDYYYDWVCMVNGTEGQPADLIKEGDTIVWEWKQVARELVD